MGWLIGIVTACVAGLSIALGIQSNRAKKLKEETKEQEQIIERYEEINTKAAELRKKQDETKEEYKEHKAPESAGASVSDDIARRSSDFLDQLRNRKGNTTPAD